MASASGSSSSSNAYIPDDLIKQILPHLSLTSLLRFRAVSQKWKRILAPHIEKFNKLTSQEKVMRQLHIAAVWVLDEIKPGETIGQTLKRLEKDAAECHCDYKTCVTKMREFKEDYNTVTMWDDKIESKTRDQMCDIACEIARICNPRISPEELRDIRKLANE